MTRSMLLEIFSRAIANMEGYHVVGSRAARNNNPGNLRSWGSRPTEGGYAKFETPEDGFAALRKQIGKNVDRGLTFYEFFAGKPGVYPGYAPSGDKNDPQNYAKYVAKYFAVPPTTVIKTLITT